MIIYNVSLILIPLALLFFSDLDLDKGTERFLVRGCIFFNFIDLLVVFVMPRCSTLLFSSFRSPPASVVVPSENTAGQKFKKVQTKKLVKSNKSISRIIFLTKLHFLPFQKWPTINFWTGENCQKCNFTNFFPTFFSYQGNVTKICGRLIWNHI